MEKILRFLVGVAVLLAVAMVPWRAEAQQSMPAVQGPQSAAADASVEGTVKKVNPAARTLDVSAGALGLWVRTLEITNGTQIESEGRQATLEDIHEGAKVKASYENRAGKSFAIHIDLLTMPEPKKAPGQTGPTTQ
jgi:Cu/Ag efflux protein CusF